MDSFMHDISVIEDCTAKLKLLLKEDTISSLVQAFVLTQKTLRGAVYLDSYKEISKRIIDKLNQQGENDFPFFSFKTTNDAEHNIIISYKNYGIGVIHLHSSMFSFRELARLQNNAKQEITRLGALRLESIFKAHSEKSKKQLEKSFFNATFNRDFFDEAASKIPYIIDFLIEKDFVFSGE